MLAIQTTFVGQTAKHPAKIVARSGISKISIPFNGELDMSVNHIAAVREMCAALGRSPEHIGAMHGEDMYWVPTHSPFQVREVQEPVQASAEVPAIPHAADPQSAPVEPATALPEPAKPARVRRAA